VPFDNPLHHLGITPMLKCLILDELREISRFCLCGRGGGGPGWRKPHRAGSSDDGGPQAMTHQHKDVERTSAGRNRRSPAAVSGTLDAAKRAAKIAELRELME
jgi:hypothetical protein